MIYKNLLLPKNKTLEGQGYPFDWEYVLNTAERTENNLSLLSLHRVLFERFVNYDRAFILSEMNELINM